MMPRAVAELFAHAERDRSHHYSFTMSYVQIYMELIQVRNSHKLHELKALKCGFERV